MAIFGHFSPVFRGIFIRDEIIVVTGTFGQKRYICRQKQRLVPKTICDLKVWTLFTLLKESIFSQTIKKDLFQSEILAINILEKFIFDNSLNYRFYTILFLSIIQQMFMFYV